MWRPHLLPRWIVRACHLADGVIWRVYIILVAASVLPGTTDRFAYRAWFAATTLAMHLNYYSRMPETKRMYFVHTYTALVLGTVWNPVAREGALRLIVAHQLGSAGLVKITIAGWSDWIDGRSMQLWLQSYCGRSRLHPLHCTALTNILLSSTAICCILNAASLAFELCWPFVILTASKSLLVASCWVGCLFHLGILIASGIAFYCSPLAYLLLASLATDTSVEALYLNVPCAVVVALAIYAFVVSLDDFPFNEMALFPFSHKQMDEIAQFYHTFFLALRADNGDILVHGPDLVMLSFFSVPTVNNERLRKVLVASYATDEDRRAALAAFVKRNRFYIEPESFEYYNDVVVNLPAKNNAGAATMPLGAARGFGRKTAL